MRDDQLDIALAAMQSALREISSGQDCHYQGQSDRPSPCPCQTCVAKRALRTAARWRFLGGRHRRTHGLGDPRETLIADAWERYMTSAGGGSADHRLAQILADDEGDDESPSVRDWYVASTVVQWLATNVGSTVLQGGGFEYAHHERDHILHGARARARHHDRPVIRVVSGVYLDVEDRMLMTFRPADKPRPSMWEHPGGKVEDGDLDDLRVALAREWNEELGVSAEVGELLVTFPLEVEVTLIMHLFHVVRIVGGPRPLAATELRYLMPEYAIQHLPCAPATYHFHAPIMQLLERRRRGWVPR